MEREAFIIEKWMEFLVQDDSKETLHRYEHEMKEQLSEVLREMGEVHVRQIETRDPNAFSDRRTVIAAKLDCLEMFLLIIDCMKQKLLFLTKLLNPATPDDLIHQELPYQQMLEKIVFVEKQRLATKPRPLQFPWDKYPFRALSMICFPETSSPATE